MLASGDRMVTNETISLFQGTVRQGREAVSETATETSGLLQAESHSKVMRFSENPG